MLCGSDRAPGVRLTLCLLSVHGKATEVPYRMLSLTSPLEKEHSVKLNN